MPILVITQGPQAGRRVVVESELILGRDDADIELDDAEVSRRHAAIQLEGADLVIRDLASLNGTWVNGTRIHQPQRLDPGDEIRVGTTAIKVAAEPQPAAAPGLRPEAVAESWPPEALESPPGPPPEAWPEPASLPQTTGVGRLPVVRRPPRHLLGAGLVAALLLQLVFAASYIGAAHHPSPRHVPIAIAGPTAVAAAVAARIRSSGDLLKPIPVATEDELMRRIDRRNVYGGLVLGTRRDRLVVADAANISVSALLVDGLSRFEASLRRPLAVVHVKPLPAGDSRGLSSFYAAVAWVFGGYLGATILSVLGGPAARGRRHAARRVGVLALYAIVSGVLGALLAGPVIGALEGHFPALVGIGALIVLGTAVTTAGFQALFGIAGTAVALVAFLILGNPSSGGPVAPELLPGFWRTIGEWLPPGAGVTSIRNTVYFGAHGVVVPLIVLSTYVVLGVSMLLLAGWRRHVRASSAEIEVAAGAAAA